MPSYRFLDQHRAALRWTSPGYCGSVQGFTFLLTQQKDVWLIYISLLPRHNFLPEVLAEVRPHSILLSAVSPSACYPLLTLLILPSARPNTGSVGKLFSCPRLPYLSPATLFLLSVCLHSADFHQVRPPVRVIIWALLCSSPHRVAPLPSLPPPLNFSPLFVQPVWRSVGQSRGGYIRDIVQAWM